MFNLYSNTSKQTKCRNNKKLLSAKYFLDGYSKFWYIVLGFYLNSFFHN